MRWRRPPLVSAIIPFYGHPQFVAAAVESALLQTYPHIEIVVVDDGSPTPAEPALRRFGERIRLVRQENRGAAAARNRGVVEARGSLIALLDDDDLWLPEKIERQVRELLEDAGAAFVHTGRYVWREETRELFHPPTPAWSRGNVYPRVVLECPVTLSTAVVRRACLEAVGGFDEALRLVDDYDLWIRLSRRWRACLVDEPLAVWREHAGNSGRARLDLVLGHLRVLERALADDPGLWDLVGRDRVRLALHEQVMGIARMLYAARRFSEAGEYLRRAFSLRPRLLSALLLGSTLLPAALVGALLSARKALMGSRWPRPTPLPAPAPRRPWRRRLAWARAHEPAPAMSPLGPSLAPRDPCAASAGSGSHPLTFYSHGAVTRGGGSLRYIEILGEELQRRGWAPEVVTREGPAGSAASRAVGRSPGRSGAALRDAYRAVVPRSLRFAAGELREVAFLRRRLAGLDACLLHVNEVGCDAAGIAARLAGRCPLVGTLHIIPSGDPRDTGPVHRTIEWASLRCFDALIAVSDEVGRLWARRVGLPRASIRTVYNGIPDPGPVTGGRRDEARAALSLAPGDLGVLISARLASMKAHHHLLAAWPAVVRGVPAARLRVVGTGPLEAELRAHAQALGLHQTVQFLGFRESADRLNDGADLAVQCSVFAEALPFALIEAIARGCPAVATRIGGVPEIILDGECGLIVPRARPDRLAAAIIHLLRSPEERARMGEAARRHYLARFRVEDMVDKTIAVYEEVLRRRGRRGGARA